MNSVRVDDLPEVSHVPPYLTVLWRVVVPAFDEGQAMRIADKITDVCGCAVEAYIAIQDSQQTVVLSDTVIKRIVKPTRAETSNGESA